MDIFSLFTLVIAFVAALAALLAWRSAAGLRESLTQTLTRILDAQGRIEQGLRAEFSEANRALRAELTDGQQQLRQAISGEAAAGRTENADSLARFAAGFHDRLQGLIDTTDRRGLEVRQTVEQRLAALQHENASKLDEMRRLVDEKLHATLRERLGESFRQVSDRLEAVHKGLGEMQALAAGVGDLKRVLTNVKTRGTWGEVQLARLIEDVMTPDQYARNVKPVPGSDAMVEFAIRFPGRDADNGPMWLPIDAKFPKEEYERLLTAADAADVEAERAASAALARAVETQARQIASKYVAPPHTTDFAIMFLPSESLYAEVLRRPGLFDRLQAQRVVVAGPANFAAILNSLQMGFRTLAIEKQSSEVWQVLRSVKTEFGKFGDSLAQVKKSLESASNRIGQTEVRTRVMLRNLRAVEVLPGTPEADDNRLEDCSAAGDNDEP